VGQLTDILHLLAKSTIKQQVIEVHYVNQNKTALQSISFWTDDKGECEPKNI